MIKDNNTKKLLTLILAVSLMLLVCIAVDYASNDTITASNVSQDLPKDAIVINDSYYLPKDAGVAKLKGVVVEKQKAAKVPLITITSKPSCGCRYSYTWHTRTFVNYCPYCKRYGTLTNLHKFPARFEQEISCKRCSSDWCGCCGKEKYSWSHRYLIPA